MKNKLKYLLLFCLAFIQYNAQQNFDAYDFLQETKKNEFYNFYNASIEFKLIENKLVYDYEILKEATYPTDKSSYSGPQSITYSDYYTNNVKLKAKMLRASKSGRFKGKKINQFYSKTVASEGIFYEDQIQRHFSLPSFKPGDRSQLQFSCRGIDPLLTSRFIFNLEMPIQQLNYKIVIPDFLKMKFVFVGDSSGIIHIIKKEKKQTIHIFSGHNRVPIDFEDQAEDIAYYTPHLFIIPISYTAAGKEISLAGTTSNLFKYYNTQIKTMLASNNDELNRITQQLIQNNNDTLSKIKVIYDWVQKNIKYVAFEEGPNGFIPRPAEKILNNKYGDCKDKANLLINMLNHANIPA
ncbi:MAG: transglutaminase domain-containing protein, partial [Bacteroidota bacterium]